MRPAHSLTSFVLALAMGAIALPSLAAEPPLAANTATAAGKTTPAVFNPAAPTLPLQHQPLTASGAIVAQPGDWKAANAAVAQFPRGHADVLKWEKAQATAASKTTQPTAPPKAPPIAPAHDSAHPSGAKP